MGQQVGLDEIDIQCAREGASIQRFRAEIGPSIGRVGTPRNRSKIRHSKSDVNTHISKGARPGVWKGI